MTAKVKSPVSELDLGRGFIRLLSLILELSVFTDPANALALQLLVRPE